MPKFTLEQALLLVEENAKRRELEALKLQEKETNDKILHETIQKEIKSILPFVLENTIPQIIQKATELVESKLVPIVSNIKPGNDGITPVKGLDYFDGNDGYTPVKGKDYFDGKDGSPDTPEEVRDKLQTLEGEERLDASAIKNLPEPVQKIIQEWGGYGAYDLNLKPITLGQITSNQNNYSIGLGAWFRLSTDASRTITGFEGGTEGRGFIITNVGSNDIVLANESASSNTGNRIVTGTGADITIATLESAWVIYDSESSRWRVLLFEAIGSAGMNTETPSGAVDGSNVTFTVSNQPDFIISDGMARVEGFGYSYSSGTITMDIPPFQYIRSFY